MTRLNDELTALRQLCRRLMDDCAGGELSDAFERIEDVEDAVLRCFEARAPAGASAFPASDFLDLTEPEGRAAKLERLSARYRAGRGEASANAAGRIGDLADHYRRQTGKVRVRPSTPASPGRAEEQRDDLC